MFAPGDFRVHRLSVEATALQEAIVTEDRMVGAGRRWIGDCVTDTRRRRSGGRVAGRWRWRRRRHRRRRLTNNLSHRLSKTTAYCGDGCRRRRRTAEMEARRRYMLTRPWRPEARGDGGGASGGGGTRGTPPSAASCVCRSRTAIRVRTRGTWRAPRRQSEVELLFAPPGLRRRLPHRASARCRRGASRAHASTEHDRPFARVIVGVVVDDRAPASISARSRRPRSRCAAGGSAEEARLLGCMAFERGARGRAAALGSSSLRARPRSSGNVVAVLVEGRRRQRGRRPRADGGPARSRRSCATTRPELGAVGRLHRGRGHREPARCTSPNSTGRRGPFGARASADRRRDRRPLGPSRLLSPRPRRGRTRRAAH